MALVGAVTLALALSAAACGDSSGASGDADGHGADSATTGDGTEDGDTGSAADSGATPTTDTADTASAADAAGGDAAETGPTLDPYFSLGTNVTGEATPASFTELEEGDQLFVEYGAQGLWMVVLAFRTRDMFEGRLTLIASIETDEKELGQFGIAKQELIDGADGFDYYYNFFLVVEDATIAGETGYIEFSIEDDTGFEFETSLQVELAGGYQPDAED